MLELYLVTAANHLLHSKSESNESMLVGLAILGDTSFITTSGGIKDKDGTVSLGGTGDHVLDEVTVSRGINDSAVVLAGLELRQGDIDGDTPLTLSLELVEHPCVLDGLLVHNGSLFLKLLHHMLVNTSKLVDQVASGGRLARADVANDHNVDVTLLLTHGCGIKQINSKKQSMG